jgi:hypothetical protein
MEKVVAGLGGRYKTEIGESWNEDVDGIRKVGRQEGRKGEAVHRCNSTFIPLPSPFNYSWHSG